MAFLSITIIT